MLENYNSLAAMTLNAITQTNVPHPFSPADGTAANPQVNLLEGSQSQENKFTASDLQQTLYPIAGAVFYSSYISISDNN